MSAIEKRLRRPLNFNFTQLKNACLEVLDSDPSSNDLKTGRIWLNRLQKALKWYDGDGISSGGGSISVGVYVGDHDASSGGLPTTGNGSGNAILQGNMWMVSVAGTIDGIGFLSIGDLLIARIDAASSSTHFIALQGKLVAGAHGNLGGGDLHSTATPSVHGFMSSSDKTKLDGMSESNIELTPEGNVNIPDGKVYMSGGVDIINKTKIKSLTHRTTPFTDVSQVNVNHNLGKRPAVTILDTSGSEYEADVDHIDENNLVVRFELVMSGIVICN